MPKVVPEYKKIAREKILLASQELFANYGYGKTSMEDIARKVGVSKAALYLYFRSKEELLGGLYESSPSTFGEILASSFNGTMTEKNAEEFFEKMADQYAAYPSFSFEIFSEAAHNSAIKDAVFRKYEGYTEIISEFLERKSDGRIVDVFDKKMMSFALIGIWNGMETLLVAGLSGEEVKRAWITVWSAIISYVGRRMNDESA